MCLLLFAAGTLYLVFGELQEGLVLFGCNSQVKPDTCSGSFFVILTL
jgi:hypothetical protein